MNEQLTVEQVSILEWLDNTDDFSPRSRSAIAIMCHNGLLYFSEDKDYYVATSKGAKELKAYRERHPTLTSNDTTMNEADLMVIGTLQEDNMRLQAQVKTLDKQVTAMQMLHIEAQQENDNLRAELLKAPNAQMVAMISAFEVYIEQQITSARTNYEEAINTENDVEYGTLMALGDMKAEFTKLKAGHLGAEAEVE